MSLKFTALMEKFRAAHPGEPFEIDESWRQGRSTYGGLTAALCLAAVTAEIPDLPPLRSATVSFVGPAAGAVGVAVKLLRRGKSVVFIEAVLSGEKGVVTHCVFAFGATRASEASAMYLPSPRQPAPEDCDIYIPEGLGPVYLQNFETRLAVGARPFSGDDIHDCFVWARHADAAARDYVALMALADVMPPAVTISASTMAPISTVTWLVNFASEKIETREGWYLIRNCAENASEGYSSQEMSIWNADQQLVATMKQSVAIFF